MTAATPEGVLARCHGEGRAALIGYLPVGYPDVATSIEAMVAAAAAGLDLLEIGVPYSDPVMDGPLIAAAVDSALRGGVRVDDAMTAGRTVSEAQPQVAVLLMTYWNPVVRRGTDTFAATAVGHGISGVITPDLLPDEAGDWIAATDRVGLQRTFLVAPSSPSPRLTRAAAASNGFVYAASTMGVTGVRGAVAPVARDLVARTRAAGARHVCVGLGISTAEQAGEVAGYADGVIVGSALVRALGPDGDVAALAGTVEDLAGGVRSGSEPAGTLT